MADVGGKDIVKSIICSTLVLMVSFVGHSRL
jgi:hypothetical protein